MTQTHAHTIRNLFIKARRLTRSMRSDYVRRGATFGCILCLFFGLARGDELASASSEIMPTSEMIGNNTDHTPKATTPRPRGLRYPPDAHRLRPPVASSAQRELIFTLFSEKSTPDEQADEVSLTPPPVPESETQKMVVTPLPANTNSRAHASHNEDTPTQDTPKRRRTLRDFPLVSRFVAKPKQTPQPITESLPSSSASSASHTQATIAKVNSTEPTPNKVGPDPITAKKAPAPTSGASHSATPIAKPSANEIKTVHVEASTPVAESTPSLNKKNINKTADTQHPVASTIASDAHNASSAMTTTDIKTTQKTTSEIISKANEKNINKKIVSPVEASSIPAEQPHARLVRHHPPLSRPAPEPEKIQTSHADESTENDSSDESLFRRMRHAISRTKSQPDLKIADETTPSTTSISSTASSPANSIDTVNVYASSKSATTHEGTITTLNMRDSTTEANHQKAMDRVNTLIKQEGWGTANRTVTSTKKSSNTPSLINDEPPFSHAQQAMPYGLTHAVEPPLTSINTTRPRATSPSHDAPAAKTITSSQRSDADTPLLLQAEVTLDDAAASVNPAYAATNPSELQPTREESFQSLDELRTTHRNQPRNNEGSTASIHDTALASAPPAKEVSVLFHKSDPAYADMLSNKQEKMASVKDSEPTAAHYAPLEKAATSMESPKTDAMSETTSAKMIDPVVSTETPTHTSQGRSVWFPFFRARKKSDTPPSIPSETTLASATSTTESLSKTTHTDERSNEVVARKYASTLSPSDSGDDARTLATPPASDADRRTITHVNEAGSEAAAPSSEITEMQYALSSTILSSDDTTKTDEDAFMSIHSAHVTEEPRIPSESTKTQAEDHMPIAKHIVNETTDTSITENTTSKNNATYTAQPTSTMHENQKTIDTPPPTERSWMLPSTGTAAFRLDATDTGTTARVTSPITSDDNMTQIDKHTNLSQNPPVPITWPRLPRVDISRGVTRIPMAAPLPEAVWSDKPGTGPLTPGERVLISVAFVPESTREVVIDADGRMTYLHGIRMTASGLSPAQIAGILHDRLGIYLTDPQVTVMRVLPHDGVVTVLGCGTQAESVALGKSATVLDMFNLFGWTASSSGKATFPDIIMKDACIVREGSVLPLALERLVQEHDPRAATPLHASDVIILPLRNATPTAIPVLGSVAAPKIWRVDGAPTLMRAIAAAGGTIQAEQHLVGILRGPLASPRVIRADLTRIAEGTEPDVRLEAHDIIHVAPHAQEHDRDIVRAALTALSELGAAQNDL